MGDRLATKVALVTGAGQGLGLAIARHFRCHGATVVGTDINESAASAIEEAGATFLDQDVRSEERWREILGTIEARFGALHVLVNNAGIEGASTAAKDPENAPLADWELMFSVNSTGTFLGCKTGIALMARSGGGSIINLSSVASMVPTPFLTAYGASKAAVAQLTRSVALHCAQAGYAIRCNSLHPGQVRTPMLERLFARMACAQGVPQSELEADFVSRNIPLRGFQKPIDIAHLALFLASDEARFVTGQAIACDGGYTLVA